MSLTYLLNNIVTALLSHFEIAAVHSTYGFGVIKNID